MKKAIFGALLVVGVSMAATSGASAQNIRQCVIEKSMDQLTKGQQALVKAHGDGKINALSVARENHLTLLDIVKVHAFMTSAGISCALGG